MSDDLVHAVVDGIVAKRPPAEPPKAERPSKVRWVPPEPKPRPKAYNTQEVSRQMVRDALRKYPDGLTLTQLSNATGISRDSTLPRIIKSEHGVSIYIDHWTQVRGQWVAVYALCECPEDCPEPGV